MADETEKNDNSLYLAAGNKIFNQMERLTAKQEKVSDQQDEAQREALRNKAQSVSNIKKIAVTQGGAPLTTKNIASVLGQVATTVTNRINQMAVTTTKQFLPIDSQIKQVNDLLSSNYEGDIDKGFELIDRLQSRLGVDLGKYSKEIGDSVQKLYDMNRQRKEDKAEAERIRIEKTQELTQERDILRERGINTYVNSKEGKLEIKSKKEERIELKRIQEEEKKLKQEEKDLAFDLKQLRKQDTIDKEDQEKILLRQENLSEKNKLLERDKERAGLKPKERVSGMLDQTVGEAFRQIKTFGKEIVQLGGDLFKGFGKLAGMVGKLALGFIKLVLIIAGIMLVFILVGLVIYGLYKIIKSVIDFFANIFDGISKIWPFSLLKKDDAKNKEVGDKSKTKVPGEEKPPEKGYIEEGRSVEKVAPGSLQNRSDAMADGEKAKILPINAQNMQEGDTSISNQSYLRTSKSAPVNLNKMSVENQASSESKSANNTVIAPNVSNSSVNASNTQAMSMEPTNFDRSFINLNSVPV
jgi:hypothetical protein